MVYSVRRVYDREAVIMPPGSGMNPTHAARTL
jgi:hypothetical protein